MMPIKIPDLALELEEKEKKHTHQVLGGRAVDVVLFVAIETLNELLRSRIRIWMLLGAAKAKIPMSRSAVVELITSPQYIL